jgi:hypothetical protein
MIHLHSILYHEMKIGDCFQFGKNGPKKNETFLLTDLLILDVHVLRLR